jgi:hypothetical protein
MTKITAYKAFKDDWTCRGFQFEVGKTYEHEGEIEICRSGFHACLNPLDMLRYYPLIGSNFAEVEFEGDTKTHKEDSKICGAKITISAKVEFGDLIERAVSWIVRSVKEGATSGDRSHSATSGDRSPSATSGDRSHSATSGDRSPSATSGDRSPSATSGYDSPSATSGDRSPSATSGNYSHSATSGYDSPSATSGNYSPSATSGYDSPSATSGNRSPSATSGDRSPSEASGKNSIAVAIGRSSKARAGETGGIALAEYDTDGNLVSMFASLVGQNGIKPNVWYELKDGKPVEVTS